MPRYVVIAVTVSLLIGLVAAVTVLVVLHDPTADLIGFATGSILPTLTALFAYSEASKAGASAAQAVSNTNGLLHAAAAADPRSGLAQAITSMDTPAPPDAPAAPLPGAPQSAPPTTSPTDDQLRAGR